MKEAIKKQGGTGTDSSAQSNHSMEVIRRVIYRVSAFSAFCIHVLTNAGRIYTDKSRRV